MMTTLSWARGAADLPATLAMGGRFGGWMWLVMEVILWSGFDILEELLGRNYWDMKVVWVVVGDAIGWS